MSTESIPLEEFQRRRSGQEGRQIMTASVPHVQDIVRVHPGVIVDGRHLGGMHLTVTATVTLVELDATETAGGRPIHLLSSQVDIVHSFGGIR